MKRSGTFIAVCFLACTGMSSRLAAAPIVLVGILSDVQGKAIQGTITIYTTAGDLTSTHHLTDEMGGFRINADSSKKLIVHAQSPGHPPGELLVPVGSAGIVPVAIVLQIGQTIRGQVVDAQGNGIPQAIVQARYHEPEKPIRRVLLDDGSLTDGAGEFVLRNVGIDIPFYIDVLAPRHPPSHSKLLKLGVSETKLEDIVLGEPGATIVVNVVDRSGQPLEGVPVVLFADPSNFDRSARGSWLFPMGFKKNSETSGLGKRSICWRSARTGDCPGEDQRR